ncbi:MAG: prepilin-type N-terminal cleavage/methylation domain-containing protein [Xanthomonadales bacterium]|nr:prepilin-type N-terminal cleavage/methylation domain-containing protein [Xanthomonadales bacterium]
MPSKVQPTSKRINGFTLIEFVVALVIIGIGAAILTSFVTPTASSADPMIQAQARSIATGYMDEILLRRHGNPGECNGGSRGTYDTVWCYDGLNQAPANQFGNAINVLDSYLVNVSVTGGAPANIAVNVSHESGNVNYSLQSQRGAY